MDPQSLIQAGLTPKEAFLYLKMLQTGPLTVGKLLHHVPYKRGDLYNILHSLRDKGLAIEEVKDGLLTYTLTDPSKLEDFVRSQEERLEQNRKTISSLIPELQSLYNLSLQRPGVRFFEGREGIWKVLEDSLTAKTEITSITDIDSIVKHIGDLNEKYAKKRARLHLRKRGLVLDTPFARNYLKSYLREITETKLIAPNAGILFESIMQIYDTKVSYITLAEQNMIGVIIEDPIINRMHRMLFDHIWNTTQPTVFDASLSPQLV
ncbi:MAG: helix-turn-helix domain-containing protein [Patescibacteria group bacterium]